MDKFYEQLLTTKKGSTYRILNLLMYFTGIMCALSLISLISMFKLFYVIYAVAFGAATFFLRLKRDESYREFEYIFTNGNFQIDMILAQKKRKTIFDVDAKDFDEFGVYSSGKLDKNNINCVPWDRQGEKYFIKSGKNTYIILPDEETLRLLRIYCKMGMHRS